jgi:hypothetical protein
MGEREAQSHREAPIVCAQDELCWLKLGYSDSNLAVQVSASHAAWLPQLPTSVRRVQCKTP